VILPEPGLDRCATCGAPLRSQLPPIEPAEPTFRIRPGADYRYRSADLATPAGWRQLQLDDDSAALWYRDGLQVAVIHGPSEASTWLRSAGMTLVHRDAHRQVYLGRMAAAGSFICYPSDDQASSGSQRSIEPCSHIPRDGTDVH
jgi:hypothetical protein